MWDSSGVLFYLDFLFSYIFHSLNIFFMIELRNRWPHRLAARTSPSHGGNPGSIPGGVTIQRHHHDGDIFNTLIELIIEYFEK